MIDDIAEGMDIDPFELRQRNIVQEGGTTLHGWKVTSSRLPECLRRVAKISDYHTRHHATPHPAAHDISDHEHRPQLLHGIGLSIGHHVTGYRTIVADYDGSSAILRLGGDADVTLLVGEPDIGQGHNTILAQLVAEGLDIPVEAVRVQGIDTALSPAAVGTLASRGATLAGNAALAATDDARRQLAEFVAEHHWHVPADRVSWDGHAFTCTADDHPPVYLVDALRSYAAVNCGLPILGRGVYRPATVMPDATGYGNPSVAYPFAAHIAEVEVDPATGQVRVTRYWAVHDSGTILNPSTARGQVLGGIAQGIGWALTEDVVSADGRVRNPNFLDYRIPGAGDMPLVDVEFVDGYEPNGPLGAKSLGEVALDPVTAAIANAIHNATGIRCHDLPIAPERLWRLLQAQPSPAAVVGSLDETPVG
jgi:CO/xanthine dehydrogenase Mo-binding subunit